MHDVRPRLRVPGTHPGRVGGPTHGGPVLIAWILEQLLAGVIAAVFGGPPFWAVWQLCDRTRDHLTHRPTRKAHR